MCSLELIGDIDIRYVTTEEVSYLEGYFRTRMHISINRSFVSHGVNLSVDDDIVNPITLSK